MKTKKILALLVVSLLLNVTVYSKTWASNEYVDHGVVPGIQDNIDLGLNGFTIGRVKHINKYDGLIFTSFGDYGANANPINITPFNPVTNTFEPAEVSLPFEDTIAMRIINNKLYIPSIDHECSGICPNGYAVRDLSGNWQVETPVNAEHVFDMASLGGNDLWMFGGSFDTAYAWRSTDGGATWNVAGTSTTNPGVDTSERYYWGVAIGDKMYMQSDTFGTVGDIQIFDSSDNSWSNYPVIGSGGGYM